LVNPIVVQCNPVRRTRLPFTWRLPIYRDTPTSASGARLRIVANKAACWTVVGQQWAKPANTAMILPACRARS
jgi:hypothetical protein